MGMLLPLRRLPSELRRAGGCLVRCAIENFEWTGDRPRTYESSLGVYRHFCGTCGSPIGFEADHYPGGLHFYDASLENLENFEPAFYVNKQSKLP